MALPSSMTAIEIGAAGGPEVLRVTTRPVPAPGRGQLLLKVAAAGVNPHDCIQRRRGAPPPGATDIPGIEVCGTVVAAGDGVAPDMARAGRLVCSLCNGGSYAEYCVVEAPLAFDVPDGIDAIEGAGIQETLFTAWLNAIELGKLEPGQWMLVHGGTGGVSSRAIQLGRLLGAHVIATSGSAEKREICKALGAEVTIDYTQGGIADAVLRITEGRGVDVVIDVTGPRYFTENLRALAPDGRVTYIGVVGGDDTCTFPLRALTAKRAAVLGAQLRVSPLALKLKMAQAIRERVWPAIGKTIRTRVDSTFPLAQAVDAHRRIESGAHIGKVVLVVGK